MQLIDISTKRQSLSDIVRHRLSRAIVSGELVAGEKLAEPELAAKLNVSRAPIREALIALEFDGLVQSDDRGRSVTPPLKRADLEEILLLRLGLEPMACGRAATLITQSQCEQLKANLKQTLEVTSHSQVARLDIEFHDIILQASGLKRFQHAWHSVCLQVELLLNQLQSTKYPDLEKLKNTTFLSHQKLLDALASGHEQTAQEMMTDHLKGWMSFLEILPE